MTPRILISGSVAYDTIMVFDGHFKDHILPDRVHMLNVAFLTPQLKREFGGTAANIAYNLKALGGQPVVLATVGLDGQDYVRRLSEFGIDTSQIITLPESYTAQCFITTDLADNQITAFHPGAMNEAHQVDAAKAAASGGAAWGIVSPNGKQAMLQHVDQFHSQGVPFIFDPGQGLPMFDANELRAIISKANALTVNDYEASMLCSKLEIDEATLAKQLPVLIITRGALGSTVFQEGKAISVAVAPISKAIDPTGCGDAYRAGLLYGLGQGWSWPTSARLGSVMGAIKIESQGPQNHRVSWDLITSRHQQAYGAGPGMA
jgi:adenosine kinase